MPLAAGRYPSGCAARTAGNDQPDGENVQRFLNSPAPAPWPSTGRLDRRSLLAAFGAASIAAAVPGRACAALPGAGKRRVIVLGAGIAGLVAARELERAGHEAIVLEALERVGGWVWTVRGGDRFSDTAGVEQQVRFSPGLYQNAGAARIPSHHDAILGLCRDLGVPLEVLVNSSRSAFLGGAAGQDALRLRQAANDLRGHLSELLETALRKGSFDTELSGPTRTALARFLTTYGDLDPAGHFRGTARSGLARVPGAFDEVQQAVAPRTLDDLLANPNLAGLLFEEDVLMQATMLAPRGGMDAIPRALARSLRRPVTRGARVTRIRREGSGVRVVWRDPRGGEHAAVADAAIITIPLSVLAGIDADFSAPVRRAIAGARYSAAIKVAFESAPFWEAQQIYGGLSFTGGDTGIIWYPSDRFQAPRQVLLAAYASRDGARTLGARSLSDQVAAARAAVERIHPGHGPDLINPVVIDWARQPFSQGPWIEWDQDGNDPAAFRLLNQNDGPFLFAGSHLSQYSGHWQEGAVLSARRAVAALTTAADQQIST